MAQQFEINRITEDNYSDSFLINNLEEKLKKYDFHIEGVPEEKLIETINGPVLTTKKKALLDKECFEITYRREEICHDCASGILPDPQRVIEKLVVEYNGRKLRNLFKQIFTFK